MKKSAHLVHRQRGLATVEMALVTPVLLIILLVTFEFTRAFYQQNTLTKAVRDATRLISTDAFKGDFFKVTDQEKEEAIKLAVHGNIAGTGPKVIENLMLADFTYDEPVVLSGGIPLQHVQISASYEFQPLWPIIRNMNFLSADIDNSQASPLTLTATSTMRALK